MTDENKTQVPKPAEGSVPEQVPAWAKSLVDQVQKLATENEMLKELAGNNAIKSLIESKRDFSVKKAKFKIINDKVVVGWEKLDDTEFVFDPKNRGKEKLTMTVHYRNSQEKDKVDYLYFIRCNDYVEADILSYDPFGKATVRFDNGDQLTLDSKFLNA